MRTFQYKLGDRLLSIAVNEAQGSVTGLLVDGEPLRPEAGEMPAYAAVIALALIEHEVEFVHDEETGLITVGRHATPWSSPARQMKTLK